jgi:hypothetical protein
VETDRYAEDFLACANAQTQLRGRGAMRMSVTIKIIMEIRISVDQEPDHP